MSLAREPEKPGTSSCSVLRTSRYSWDRMSERVEITCPSFTKVGPRRRRPSRMKRAASVCAAEASASLPSFLPSFFAFSTRRTLWIANFHTPTLRRQAGPLPRLSQPRSSSSPRATALPTSMSSGTSHSSLSAAPMQRFIAATIRLCLRNFLRSTGIFSASSFAKGFRACATLLVSTTRAFSSCFTSFRSKVAVALTVTALPWRVERRPMVAAFAAMPRAAAVSATRPLANLSEPAGRSESGAWLGCSHSAALAAGSRSARPPAAPAANVRAPRD
mmetsp:Transcript_17735/g.46789  ORF Transcript_17735/g.46789 Transcript_17735/m.46789 type:complete len:275 (-) Transcript_17735:130-954(-)